MPEDLEPILLVVEIGAVAKQNHILIAKLYSPRSNLHVGHHELVIAQFVGVVDKHLLAFGRRFCLCLDCDREA